MAWFGVEDRRETSLDIESIAKAHDLRPQRMGDRLRFLCPFCYGQSRKDRTASAALREDLQPWRCWRASCNETGNVRTLAAFYGELDLAAHRQFEARPKPTPKPKPVETFTVRQGWQELVEVSTEEDANRIYYWATDSRGWPEAVARAVSYMDDVVCSMPWNTPKGQSGRQIAHQARSSKLRMLVAIRCHQGTVRSAMRIWLGPEAPADGMRTKMALSSRVTGDSEAWGGTMIYGSIPVAIEAIEQGEPVYIVEGAPDYLAASGVLAAAASPGAVLGTFNAQTAPKLVEKLLDELNRKNLIAPRLVFIPDMDKVKVDKSTGETYQPGLDAFTKAAEILRGRAGVAMLKLPRDSDDAKMDLAQKLREVGLIRTISLMTTAPSLFPAPVSLDESGVIMSEKFKQAVAEACYKTVGGKRTIVIYQVEMGVGKTRHALDIAARIASGDIEIPVNGRRPKGVPQSAWPPPTRSVVFAASNHGEADEKVEELDHVAPGTPSRHIYGLLHYCKFAGNVEDAFPHVGRRGVCGDPRHGDECHLYQSCLGSKEPGAQRGEVTFVAHKLVDKIKADLAIIDESPGVVETESVSDFEVSSLFASKAVPLIIKWRRYANPAAADAAQILANIMTPLAFQHATRVSTGAESYGRRITGEELVKLLDEDSRLMNLLKAGFSSAAARPPVLDPSSIRHGAYSQKHMPSRSAFNALAHLVDYYRRVKGEDADDDGLVVLGPDGEPMTPAPKPTVGVYLDVQGRWSVEVRKVQPLPKCPVVILDATGAQTLAEWKAAYPDRRVVIRNIDVQGAAPAVAIHMETSAFTRKHMIGSDNAVRSDAVEKVHEVLDAVVAKARETRPGQQPIRLGVLTHKPVADAMLGRGQSGRGAAAIIGTMTASGVEFVNGFGDPTIGWFGRHDRGTNAYREVDALVVIGDPVGNYGDIEQDAMLLGLEAGDISMARTAATCRQAIARARHIRRDDDNRAVLVFAGKRRPDLPGVRWESVAMDDAKAARERNKSLHEVVLHIAAELRVLSVEIVRSFSTDETPWEGIGLGSVSTWVLDRHIRRVAKMRRWPRHTFTIVHTSPKIVCTIWSDKAALARFWCDSFYPPPTPPAPDAAAVIQGSPPPHALVVAGRA